MIIYYNNDSNYTINIMGCDYYIYKYLKINFQSIMSLFIELERDKGYFYFNLDEDDPKYDDEYKKYVKEILTPNMKPIIIYEKSKFANSKLENKYMLCIQEEINKYNNSHKDKIEFVDILNIEKIELRYERI